MVVAVLVVVVATLAQAMPGIGRLRLSNLMLETHERRTVLAAIATQVRARTVAGQRRPHTGVP
jgi:hypothetical protein